MLTLLMTGDFAGHLLGSVHEVITGEDGFEPRWRDGSWIVTGGAHGAEDLGSLAVLGIDPMGRAASNPELLLTDEQFQYLMDYIASEREAGRHVSYSCEGYLGTYEGRVRDHLYQCAAGISVASILIDGSISACTSIRGKYYQGNIYRDSFWSVWENGFKPYRDRSWMRQLEPCKDCKAWTFCEGNGMHLRREDGSLMLCHLHRLGQ